MTKFSELKTITNNLGYLYDYDVFRLFQALEIAAQEVLDYDPAVAPQADVDKVIDRWLRETENQENI